MRHNRHSPCHSLFEQAQLESEIDVYEYSGLNKLVQHCSSNKIAIGGGNLLEYLRLNEAKEDGHVASSPIEVPHDTIPSPPDDLSHGAVPSPPVDLSHAAVLPPPTDLEQLEETSGFGIVVGEFLARGSTSPCATFRNPSLLHKLAETETFEIANMEVWSLTPAWDVDYAEKLEMTKYFADQSSHTESLSSIHSTRSMLSDRGGACTPPRADSLAASDMVQSRFYRRVGEDDEGEEQRDRWQYANMMGMM